MTSVEAAASLGIDESRVRRLINDTRSKPFNPNKLNGAKYGRNWWIEAAEVERFKQLERKPGRKAGVSPKRVEGASKKGTVK